MLCSANHTLPRLNRDNLHNLEKQWQGRHVGIRAADAATDCPPPAPRLCLPHACCCKDPWRTLLQRARLFLTGLPPSLVSSGRVVCVWQQHFVTDDETDFTQMDTVGSGFSGDTVFTHLCHLAQKPFRAVFWRLESCGSTYTPARQDSGADAESESFVRPVIANKAPALVTLQSSCAALIFNMHGTWKQQRSLTPRSRCDTSRHSPCSL